MFPCFSGKKKKQKKKATTTKKIRECEPLRLIEDFPLARHRVFKKAAAECGIIKHLQIPSPLPIMASATALSVASADPTLKTSPFITAGRDPAETAGACCLSTGHLIFSKHLLNPLSGRPGTMGARSRPRTGDPNSSPASGRRCRSLPAHGHRWWAEPKEDAGDHHSTSLHLLGKRSLATQESREIFFFKCFSTRDRCTTSFSSSKQAMQYIISNSNSSPKSATPAQSWGNST